MTDNISPSYQMKLIDDVEKAIWAKYESYKNVQFYIEKWHEYDLNWENFSIEQKEEGKIDLLQTVIRQFHCMSLIYHTFYFE